MDSMAVVGPLDKALRGFPFVKNADDYVDEGNGTDEETGGHEGDNADYEGEEDHPHSPELAGGDPSGRHGSPDPQSQPPSSGSSQTSSQGSPADTNEIERASDVPSCETGADTSGKVERPRGNTYPNTDASGTVTRPDNSFTVSGSRILKHTRIMLDTTEDSRLVLVAVAQLPVFLVELTLSSSPKPSKNTIRLQGNTTGESVDEMSQSEYAFIARRKRTA